MPVKQIVTDPEVLSNVSAPVGDETKIKQILADLLDTATANRGVCAGLAAIQLGEAARIFIVRDQNGFVPFVNPQLQYLGRTIPSTEGCLSFPKKKKMVKRFSKIAVRDDLNGKVVFEGDLAVAIQHEFDHLDGKTIFDNRASA